MKEVKPPKKPLIFYYAAAMLAVILWRIEGCPSAGAPAVFKDTEPNDWFSDGLSWCVETGLFAGYPDGSFGPNDAVTREQLAVVFHRYADAETRELEAGTAQVSVKNGCVWAADACA